MEDNRPIPPADRLLREDGKPPEFVPQKVGINVRSRGGVAVLSFNRELKQVAMSGNTAITIGKLLVKHGRKANKFSLAHGKEPA